VRGKDRIEDPLLKVSSKASPISSGLALPGTSGVERFLPLTPTLSPGEREQRLPPGNRTQPMDVLRLSCLRNLSLGAMFFVFLLGALQPAPGQERNSGSPASRRRTPYLQGIAAWRKGARFDPAKGRLSTWLMTIAHNLAVDRLRRETGVTRPHLVLVDEVPEVVGADEDEALLERDAALRALESLSDAEKQLLARAYFGGLTAREIAEADGIPLGTVKTRLRTALIKVRRANQDKERP